MNDTRNTNYYYPSSGWEVLGLLCGRTIIFATIVSREVGWLIWVYITSFIWHLIIPSLVLLSPWSSITILVGHIADNPNYISSCRSEDLKLNAASVMLWSQLGYHSNTAVYSAAKILNYLSGYKPIMSALCNYLIINQCHWN